MPHELDGPQIDRRPPGYGSTLSFGPLGPSRLAVQLNDPPSPYDEVGATVIVPHLVSTLTPLYVSTWRGVVGRIRVIVLLTVPSPADGEWLLRVGLARTDIVDPVHWGREESINFTWVDTARAFLAEDFMFPFGGLIKVAEWHTCSIRFPGCTFAEPF